MTTYQNFRSISQVFKSLNALRRISFAQDRQEAPTPALPPFDALTFAQDRQRAAVEPLNLDFSKT